MRLLPAVFFLAATAASADMGASDIVVIGEVHDNPAHHAVQAEIVAGVQPAALVFEMLTPDQAARVTPDLVADETALEAALGWRDSGWPDFSLYYPIFAAAPGARIYGASVPRDQARQVDEIGLLATFGDGGDRFGLDRPLDEAEQSARQDLQRAAHCNALPEDLLPMMVDIQRLRDAALAKAALDALHETGGPVAVITGNGHARTDWGAPALIARAAPTVSVHSIGQSEAGSGPDGLFDETRDAPPPERDDPCAAFR